MNQLTQEARREGAGRAVSLSSGFNHGCVIRSDGKLYCWGKNNNGQLGIGNTTGNTSLAGAAVVNFTGVSSPTVPVEVASGGEHACARLSDGTVWCWGRNDMGQVGNGGTSNQTSPVSVNLGSGVRARALAAGSLHTCAVLTDGKVKCWGWNSNGQIGDNSTTDRTSPVEVEINSGGSGSLSGVVALSAGGYHTCALTDRVSVSLGSAKAIHIGASNFSGCALIDNGQVRCWGANNGGQLGNNGSTDSDVPVTVASNSGGTALAGITQLSSGCGLLHNCALDNSQGGVTCWGTNGDGQLGDGTTTSRAYAQTVFVPSFGPFGFFYYNASPSGGSVLASGDQHTCTLVEFISNYATSRGVVCWGENGLGQLGDGTTTDRFEATLVAGTTSDAVAVATGSNHSCYLNNAGEVKCWGSNSNGQLGDGTTTTRTSPVSVSLGGARAIGITAGEEHTCALLSIGEVRCWGRNQWTQYNPDLYGTIGNNNASTPNFTSPQTVLGSGSATLTGVVMVVAGGRHTCALKADGTIHCWGVDYDGQIFGTGEGADQELVANGPVEYDGTNAIIATSLTAGVRGTCAVLSSGRVRCWGDSTYDQLGNDNGYQQFGPVETGTATELVDVVALYGGYQTTCALLADSTVACWGQNNYLQAGGTGSTVPFASLVRISISDDDPFSGAYAVSSGAYMSCLLRANGGPFCWGRHDNGALGSSGSGNVRFPQAVSFPL